MSTTNTNLVAELIKNPIDVEPLIAKLNLVLEKLNILKELQDTIAKIPADVLEKALKEHEPRTVTVNFGCGTVKKYTDDKITKLFKSDEITVSKNYKTVEHLFEERSIYHYDAFFTYIYELEDHCTDEGKNILGKIVKKSLRDEFNIGIPFLNGKTDKFPSNIFGYIKAISKINITDDEEKFMKSLLSTTETKYLAEVIRQRFRTIIDKKFLDFITDV